MNFPRLLPPFSMDTIMFCGPKTCAASSKAIVYGAMSQVKSKLLFVLRMKKTRNLLIVLRIGIARITKIITWFRHSTVPSIHQQFGRYENAKDVWDLLSRHYTTAGLSHDYQLWGLLINMKQTPRQPINKFLSGMQSIWDQMKQSTHIVKDPVDAAILATKRDQFHLIQFLMALTSEFEPVRATLLQQVPLPTLEFAMSQLLSHETRLRTLQPHHPDAVLATAARHLLAECPTIQCRYCHKIGHIVYNCPTKPPKPGQSGILPRPVNHSVAAAAEDSPSDPSLSSIPVSELGPMVFTMVKQFLSSSDKVSSAVSGSSDEFRFLGQAVEWDGLFELTSLHLPSTSTPPPSHVAHTASAFPLSLWHLRLVDCVSCQLAKQPALSFNNSDSFSHASFDLIHSDIWGPSPTATGEAALTAVYTINRLPSSALQNTPDLPLAAPPADSPASLQEPAPPVDPVTDQTPLLPLRRSDRVRAPPTHLRDYSCFSAVLSLHEPHTYREACTNPLWQQAMTEEFQALEKTHTWDLVDLPHGKSVIGCKWVYKIKTKSDGSIERYKARLVAKGYAQEYGIDYEETFAPVARITSVRSLLAITAVHQWPLFQMDVKNAFLNGDLTKEVYMQAPPGYSDYPDKVCLLRRALYGLKQAPRAWFAKFSSIVHQFGFSSSSHDTALFIRRSDKGMILLLLYVDDMIITGDDHSGISDFKLFLHQQFEMKDLGHLSYFLGLEVSSDSTGYYLSQAKYASDLLSRAGLTDTKVVSTPLKMNARLTPLDGTPLSDATLYRQLVGSLIYLTVTHPAHAIHLVSQFLFALHSTHYAAVIHILLYIKGTMFHGLHFSAHSTLDLCAYSDADWAGDPTDRRSTTGFCFFLGDSLISWRSKKQHIVSRSSTEAEYRALADTTSELLALRWLAIQIVHNDVFHERTKHIEIDCHLVRHHLSAGILHLLPVSSSDQTADIFTKTFPPGRFRDLVSKLKMASVRPP
uniref:Reverse transcriptase Ty1/copia-type domain-containing protein n=1 Tax=Fagus sylvatica TaxID=28930 RepID=A0A2N9I658_FAGSY